MDEKSFSVRLDAIKKADEERATFHEELLRAYRDLKLKYDERTDDYKNEVESRRLWQNKASQSEQALNQHKQASVGSKGFIHACAPLNTCRPLRTSWSL